MWMHVGLYLNLGCHMGLLAEHIGSPHDLVCISQSECHASEQRWTSSLGNAEGAGSQGSWHKDVFLHGNTQTLQNLLQGWVSVED